MREVAANYVHRDKFATPREGITVGDSRLKWSNVATPETPVSPEIEALARNFVSDAGISGDWVSSSFTAVAKAFTSCWF